MMSKHSPEPWVCYESGGDQWKDRCIRCKEDRTVAVTLCSESRRSQANANRVVACVNAMAGVPDYMLPACGNLALGLLQVPIKITAEVPSTHPLGRLVETFLNHIKKGRP